MFNNDFMLRQSRYWARRLADETNDVDQQVERAFQLAFSRSASGEELTAARKLVDLSYDLVGLERPARSAD